MANEKSKMIMDINLMLTEDIVKVIFSKLPFSDLPNCRIVCKAWNHLVCSSKFHVDPNAFFVYASDVTIQPFPLDQTQHLNPKMSCIDFDTANSVATLVLDGSCKDVIIYTSCNGLLYILKRMPLGVWCNGILNPMTNEFFETSGSQREGFGDVYRYGFGFSPETKQYKLFRITFEDFQFSSTIDVWRFGISNQWEHLGCQPFLIPYDHGSYLDGVIYWLGYKISMKTVIYTLDVETERFEPEPTLDLEPCSVAKLQPFHGLMCLIVFCSLKVEIWSMRARHSWIREFVNDLSKVGFCRFCPIKAFEDEEDKYFLVNNDLFCFGKNGKEMKIKTLFNANEKKVKGVVHMEAFHFGSLQKILSGND